MYITDMVPIPMRSENNIGNNLIKTLDSGTKLEILATENGWTKVKFEDTIGWIISRYLTSNLPARVQLKILKQNNNNNQLLLSKQQSKNTELEKKIAELKAENITLSIESGKLQSEKKHIQKTYREALELEHKNEQLKTKILQLKTELQLSKNSNIAGQDSSSRNWFIVGALVLFFGFLMGFIFPKRTNQRRF
ncbi:Bacterial SH3 domain homologue [uncultured Candidatus Thioglobus sp.]|nr:Bacterial SH3 domain homologue [uncultured Candidatus Thioglobus sp.]